MDRAQLLAVNPVLPCRDVARSIEFYAERLGFSLQLQDSAADPHYAGLRRDGVENHLQWHDSAEWEAVERPALRFVVAEVDVLFAEFQDRGVNHRGTILRETAWGTREFAFFDPDQNGLIFYCHLEDV